MKEYDDRTLKKLQNIELEILKDFIGLCDRHNLQYFGIAGTCIGVLRHQGFIPWDDDIDIALPREDFEKFLKYANEELKDKYTIMNARYDSNYPLMTTRMMLKDSKFREYALSHIDVELGIFLDIYPFDNLSDDFKKRKKQMRQAWFYSKLLILRSIPKPVLAFKGWKAKIVHLICTIVHYGMKILGISKEKLIYKCEEASTRHNDEVNSEYVDFLCDTTPTMNIYKRDDLFPLQKLKFEDIELSFPKNMDTNLRGMYGDYMQLPPVDKRKNHFPYELKFPNEPTIYGDK